LFSIFHSTSIRQSYKLITVVSKGLRSILFRFPTVLPKKSPPQLIKILSVMGSIFYVKNLDFLPTLPLWGA